MTAESLLKTPLSDDEFDALEALLEAHSPLDAEGLLGVLHAVAVAPGRIPPDAWMELVMPAGFGELDAKSAETFLGMVFRVLNEVIDTLDGKQTLAPEPEDEEGCRSFAAAYAATAAIDPLWRDDPERWGLAAPFALLGELPDLLSAPDRKRLAAVKDAKTVIREDLAVMVVETRAAFLPIRQTTVEEAISAPRPARAVSAGRNDPCTCGSGKKYKRCCGSVV